MKNIRPILILANTLLVIGFILFSVIKKEGIRNYGKLVLIPLAPQDPRSLFQGDYMILRYDWEQISTENIPSRGCIIFNLSRENVLNLVRFSETNSEKKSGEHCLKYFKHDYDVRIGAESFFFEEGKGEIFEEAKFAGVRVDDNGDKLLVGLYDQNKKELK
ncbi:GDYXXLXY domain-containing protein [Leptospira ilyithenensis]|uniref:GDYXXLXY protein n=1 Tax=Leptospira ilyithenensis TaxID=2484901 RepID=A0A4R9LPV1_9LEPT|nr:GDYXXLXY domain-containing protein [Leptospira ilyithenensis]TGN09426.1 GDYXXLXY protein [Leptospira ilyithenensis]